MINTYEESEGDYTLMRLFLFLAVLVTFFTAGANAQTNVNTTTNSTSDVTTKGQTVVISPPPSAITPSVNGSSSDLCTVGVAGAVQTQICLLYTSPSPRD